MQTDDINVSTVLALSFYSKTMRIDWNYSIYLPEKYELQENCHKKYPIIYLLHGAYGNHRNLVERFPIQNQIDDLIKRRKLPECIVVFPDGFNSFYVNGPGFNMEDAFLKDLIPIIEKSYRVSSRKEDRIIGGISMGGYGAARFALKNPELFNTALLISPAVWETRVQGDVCYDWHVFVGNDNKFSQEVWSMKHPLSYLEYYKEANSPVNFFVISGKNDQQVLYNTVQKFSKKLNKYANVSLKFDVNGTHEWPFWERATKQALEFAGRNLENK